MLILEIVGGILIAFIIIRFFKIALTLTICIAVLGIVSICAIIFYAINQALFLGLLGCGVVIAIIIMLGKLQNARLYAKEKITAEEDLPKN